MVFVWYNNVQYCSRMEHLIHNTRPSIIINGFNYLHTATYGQLIYTLVIKIYSHIWNPDGTTATLIFQSRVTYYNIIMYNTRVRMHYFRLDHRYVSCLLCFNFQHFVTCCIIVVGFIITVHKWYMCTSLQYIIICRYL